MFIRYDNENRIFFLSDNKMRDTLNIYKQFELNANEVMRFIRANSHWKQLDDHTLVANCRDDMCQLYKLFSELVSKRVGDSKASEIIEKPLPSANVLDLNSKVVYYVEGTSKLIRKNNSKQISIARRTGREDVSYCDSVIINNTVRERFFKDAKQGLYYRVHSKYIISGEDIEKYNYWSNFMDNLFKSYKDVTSGIV